jgi:carbonic anhydrase/acetyltransferase-like protein (isoleucine patch superfamily)
MSIPRRKVAVGVPAKVISDVNDEQTEFWVRIRKSYEDFATFRYPRNLKKMEG